MAKIRSTHPDQWTDEDFVTLSPCAKLLCIGLRNFSDDQGILLWKPLTFQMQVFPMGGVDISSLLEEMIGAGLAHRYTSDDDDQEYLILRDFGVWQAPQNTTFQHPLPQPLPNSRFTPPKQRGRHTDKRKIAAQNVSKDSDGTYKVHTRYIQGTTEVQPRYIQGTTLSPPEQEQEQEQESNRNRNRRGKGEEQEQEGTTKPSGNIAPKIPSPVQFKMESQEGDRLRRLCDNPAIPDPPVIRHHGDIHGIDLDTEEGLKLLIAHLLAYEPRPKPEHYYLWHKYLVRCIENPPLAQRVKQEIADVWSRCQPNATSKDLHTPDNPAQALNAIIGEIVYA